MPKCPACMTSLKTVRQRDGIYFSCGQCGGRAVTLPQIRRVAGDRFATSLLRQINGNATFGDVSCPFCTRRMRRFDSVDPAMQLDACKGCGAIWFDPSEFESVPESGVTSVDELKLQGVEALGRYRVECLNVEQATDAEPDEAWKTIPAFFGLPVETRTDSLRRLPLVTWSLAAAILVASVLAFQNLENAVAIFGLVPADAMEDFSRSVTSFFIHADICHLLGNLYFFLIFADNVEDYLGRWRFALLMLAATLAGDAAYCLSNPASTVPAIGASGGISGVIAFYALKFPHARLSWLTTWRWWWHWFQIPAWGALVLWVMLQLLTAYLERHGVTNVAGTAHLGGAAMGFLLWCWWRKRGTQDAS